VSPVANFYFNFVSMFVVAAAVTLMTELVLTKRADQLELDPEGENDPENFDVTMALEPKEKRGLAVAVIGIVACAAILFFLALPADSFLRDESGSFGPESGLMAGIRASSASDSSSSASSTATPRDRSGRQGTSPT